MSTHPIIKALQEELAKELKGLVKTHIEDYQIAIPSRLRNSEHENRSYTVMTNSFCSGHEAATERLLSIVEKAVEMAEFYGAEENLVGSITGPNGPWDYSKVDLDRGKKAREFLTTLADEVRKEGKK